MNQWLRDNAPAWTAIGVLYVALAAVMAVWVWLLRPPTWAAVAAYLLGTALFARRVARVRRARRVVHNPHNVPMRDLL